MPEVLNSTVPAGAPERYEEYTKEDAVANGQLSVQNQETDGKLHLERNQKFALVFVCVLALGVVTLGILQAKNVLKIPVANIDKNAGQQIAGMAVAVANTDSAEELKKKDTDGDGLNDFEEINVYDTSPYLADSDSDGVSDFEEIKAGEDPNCPRGQECFRNTNNANIANNANNADTITPAQLRKLLVSSGQLTQEQVDQVDDKTLMDVYKESIEKTSQTTQTSQTIVDPAALTPAQIKQLLIEQGIDEETLSQVDDATLKRLYLEALDKAKEGQE
jgi:hypothetical protein